MRTSRRQVTVHIPVRASCWQVTLRIPVCASCQQVTVRTAVPPSAHCCGCRREGARSVRTAVAARCHDHAFSFVAANTCGEPAGRCFRLLRHAFCRSCAYSRFCCGARHALCLSHAFSRAAADTVELRGPGLTASNLMPRRPARHATKRRSQGRTHA